MLRRDPIGGFARFCTGAALDHLDAREGALGRLADGAAGRQAMNLPLQVPPDVPDDLLTEREQPEPRVRVVLRLSQQVGGQRLRIGGAVGDHKQLGRTRDEIDPCSSGDERLRGCDVAVARPDDQVRRRDAAGAEGHRGDRLGAAGRENAVHPCLLGRCEDFRGDAAVATRGGAEDDLAASGHTRRDRSHQDRGAEGMPSARNVEPDALHWQQPLLENNTPSGQAERTERAFLLPREAGDARCGEAESLASLGIDRAGPGSPFRSEHLDRPAAGAIELPGQLAQRRIPLAPDLLDDPGDLPFDGAARPCLDRDGEPSRHRSLPGRCLPRSSDSTSSSEIPFASIRAEV